MKPSIPQGTRDIAPIDVRRRQFILQTIKREFELYGYQPLETPSMENLSTLMGKYGDEGDRLIFKILNNGLNDPKNQEKASQAFQNVLQGKNDVNITERALRYDLTIPFARYVVMHQNDIAFPFRRYQMQPVWRADRPQKGRYREFWQCDADVVGSNSLINEGELLCIYRGAFFNLNVPEIKIKINSRKVLAGLAECCSATEQLTNITVAIDKLDKIGWDGVAKELEQRQLSPEQIEQIHAYLKIEGSNEDRMLQMRNLLSTSELAMEGLKEIEQSLQYHKQLAQPEWTNSEIVVDFTLARGLNYYTGIIVEVATTAVNMGSIGGGGRYDDLTGLFGLKDMSGVGISFGIDRIYDVMLELNLFPEAINTSTTILFVNIEPEATDTILTYISQLRRSGIAAEIYPDTAKFDKQMKYANKRNLPFVGIIGSNELAKNVINLKNMISGVQQELSLEAVITQLKA
jgi:histidyl-tRNA synthetase